MNQNNKQIQSKRKKRDEVSQNSKKTHKFNSVKKRRIRESK